MTTLTLGRVRLGVQLAMLALTVYGGNLVGYYMAQKISNALPALSCAYDQQNGAYCVLIPFQHQMHHRVGEGIVALGTVTFELFLPMIFTFLTFFAFFVVLNKAFCGWICPLGTLQELLYRLGRWLAAPVRNLAPATVARLRPVKWLVLVGLIFLLPLLAGLGAAPHAAGDAFCQVCPSRIATTLLAADVEQVAVPRQGWLDMALAALRNAIFGFVLVAALAVRQPFCRVCPLLALHAVFRRLSPMRLVKKPSQRCERCNLCAKACPMDIAEVAREQGPKAFHADCTLCGRCVEFCPEDGTLALKWGPVPLFSSRADYFRRRVRGEKPDGTPVAVKMPKPAAAKPDQA